MLEDSGEGKTSDVGGSRLDGDGAGAGRVGGEV